MKFSKNIDFFYSGCIIILLRKRYLDKGVEKGEIMGIKINENQNIFSIETKNTSYIYFSDLVDGLNKLTFTTQPFEKEVDQIIEDNCTEYSDSQSPFFYFKNLNTNTN